MGFFDFLTSPSGGTDPNDMEGRRARALAANKNKKPVMGPEPEPFPIERQESLFAEAPSVSSPSPTNARNRYMTEIATLRDQVATELAQAQAAKNPGASQDITLLKEAILRQVPSGDYAKMSRALETYARNQGPGGIDPASLPSFGKLSEAVKGFKRESTSQSSKLQQTVLNKQLGRAELPHINQEIDSVKAQLAKLPEQRVYSASDAEDKTIAKQEKDLTSYLQTLNQQKMQAQSVLGQKSASSGMKPPLGAPQPPPTVNDDWKAKVKAALGINDDETLQTFIDIFKNAKEQGIHMNPRDRVPFDAGVRVILENWFPEHIPQMAQYAQKVMNPSFSEAKAYENATGQSSGTGDIPQADASTAMVDAERVKLKQLNQELRDAEELQSWPAIIAFVLMSFALGPQAAFLFFSNAKQKGYLKRQMKQLEADIERKDRLELERERQQFEVKQMGAMANIRGREADHDRRADFVNRWALMQKKTADTLANSDPYKNDPEFIKLDYSRNAYLKNAAAKAQAAKYEEAEEDIAAAEDVLPLIQKRMVLLQAIREGKVPAEATKTPQAMGK